MIDTGLTDHSGWWRLVVVFAAISTGCDHANKPGNTSTPPSLSIDNKHNTSTVAMNGARPVADAFLTSLMIGDARAASALVHVALKKYLAPPFFSDDLVVSYSASDMQKYLLKLTAGSTNAVIHDETIMSGMASFRGELTGGESSRFFTVRLARDHDSWLIIHFQTSRPVTKLISLAGSKNDIRLPTACAQDFLDLLGGGPDDHDLTLRLLSEEFKKRLPSPSIPDAGLGYARKDVRNWLNLQRGECTGYSLTSAETTDGGVLFCGELIGLVRRPFALHLSGTNGICLVERFELK